MMTQLHRQGRLKVVVHTIKIIQSLSHAITVSKFNCPFWNWRSQRYGVIVPLVRPIWVVTVKSVNPIFVSRVPALSADSSRLTIVCRSPMYMVFSLIFPAWTVETV